MAGKRVGDGNMMRGGREVCRKNGSGKQGSSGGGEDCRAVGSRTPCEEVALVDPRKSFYCEIGCEDAKACSKWRATSDGGAVKISGLAWCGRECKFQDVDTRQNGVVGWAHETADIECLLGTVGDRGSKMRRGVSLKKENV